MLPTCLMQKRISNACCLLLMLLFSFYAIPASAQTNTLTASDMLANIASQIPFVMQLVTAIAYVMGMYLIIAGIIKLKHVGESRTMMSQEHSIKTPMIFLVIGACLLYLPSAVQVGMSSFWTNPSPYGYVTQMDQWSQVMNDIYLVVQLFGTVAFIRGLLILSHLGGHGQPGTFAKGVTHIIGGLFCINIYQLVQVVMITLGIQS